MADVSERMRKLAAMLEKEPRDVFLLYAMAMEHKKLGKAAEALEYLKTVLEVDPGYAVAHQQAGQVHEMSGDIEAAKQAYRDGIAAARKKGDLHAAEEMEGALSML